MVEGIGVFGVLKYFLFWFGIGSFLGSDVAIDFIFLFFPGMIFSGVTLALVSPVNPELKDRLVRIFSTTINSGDGAYDLVIKFGPLVTFCVFIDYLGNCILPQIGATTFSFAFFSYHLMMLYFQLDCCDYKG